LALNKKTLDQNRKKQRMKFYFLILNIKEKSEELILNELENIDDKKMLEISIKKFIEWIKMVS